MGLINKYMKKFLVFLLVAVSAIAASSPDVGLRPSTSWAADNIMSKTDAAGVRSAIGLDVGTPQQAGTNLLTKVLPRNVRKALSLNDSSAPPSWLSLAGIASCQTNETWTGTGVAIDTGTNFWGTQSIRIDALSGTARTASCTLPTDTYLQNDICLVLRVSDLTKLSQLRIRLYETAASAGYHYVDAYYLPSNRTNLFIASNSWIKLWLVRDHFAVATSPTAWDDAAPLKTVRKIEIAVTPVASQDVTVNIGEIVATRSTKMGVVLQTDDNLAVWYTQVKDQLGPYGIPVTECTSDHYVGLGAGHTSYAQLKELEDDYGWQVINHTLDHATWGSGSFSELNTWNQLDVMNKVLGGQGFKDFRYIVYPGNNGANTVGNVGDIVTNMFKGGFSSAQRAVYGNTLPNFQNVQPVVNLVSQPWIPWDYFNLQRYGLSRTNWTYDPSASIAQYRSGVTNFNHVLAFKGVIFPYTHNISDPGSSVDIGTDAWAGFVAWCIANRDNIEFMTIGEYCDRMRAFEAAQKRNYRYVY